MTQILTPYSKLFTVSDGAEFTVKGSSLREWKESCHKKDRFSINLSTQQDVLPTTSLHFEVRFDQNQVVLNSVKDGKWGQEEVKDNPFVLGGPFEVNVKCTANSFVIHFGNKKAEFEFRGNPAVWVQYIYIEGQANMSVVG